MSCRNCKHLRLNDEREIEHIFSTDYQYYCEYRNEYVDPDSSCAGFTSLPPLEKPDDNWCFLTTACVKYFEKEDDCYELTTLRYYRDNFLKNTTEGQKLIDEYYSVAPKIVKKINESGKAKEYYSYIYRVVEDCVKFIEKKEYENAKNEYLEMFYKLKAELNVTD